MESGYLLLCHKVMVCWSRRVDNVPIWTSDFKSNSYGFVFSWMQMAGDYWDWGACVLMHYMTNFKAVMWGIQSGAGMGFHKVHIETNDFPAFNLIWYQEKMIMEDYLVEVMTMFNTIHANNFKLRKTYRIVTRVPDKMQHKN